MRYEGAAYHPPGEWKSYLLQVTAGCSHNACTLCGIYKDKRYRVRPLGEIFEDIVLTRVAYGDVKRAFLCDGGTVVMDTGELLVILDRLYETFPTLERVNVYAGPGSTLRKTEEGLVVLHRVGLARLYLGMEGDSDAVLRAVRKGMDTAGMLEVRRRIVATGFDLWTVVLIGLAGQGEASWAHALGAAALINAMRPRYLSTLTCLPERGMALGNAAARGEFRLLTAWQTLEETRLLLECLEVDPLHFTNDHVSDYLPLKGGLPGDKIWLLTLLDGAFSGEQGIKPELWRGLWHKEKGIEMDGQHLHILWTNANLVAFDKMVLMYAVNSLVWGWWEKVTVILWGETSYLAAADSAVKGRVVLAMGQGVKFSACITCAKELGVEQALRDMGLEVISWGPSLTELLKTRAPLLTV